MGDPAEPKAIARLPVIACALGLVLLCTLRGAAQQCCPGERCPGDLQCDNRIDIAEIVSAVNSALNGCPPLPSSTPTSLPQPTPTGGQHFPSTGQTSCWDAAGAVIDCAGTGQDGEIRAGGGLVYIDNGDGTITDPATQLMWEQKDADGGIHDWNTNYQWSEALRFIASLNAGEGFAGHTDWRLPNVKELQSLINYEALEPAVSTAFSHDCVPGCTFGTCSCTRSFHYWSATSDIQNAVGAWSVYFTNGYLLENIKSNSLAVRAVRGSLNDGNGQRFPSTGQTTCWDSIGNVIACSGTGQDGESQVGGALAYIDNGDGTITDMNTHLTWEKKSADGSIHDWNTIYDWGTSLDTFIAALNMNGGFTGHADWRLPNVKELQSLIDYQQSAPALTGAFNANCTPGCTVNSCSCSQLFFYWSATTNAPNPGAAWAQYLGTGYVLESRKSNEFFVRAVRGP